MAQTGYSPISLYYSTTASAAPSAGNLVSGELAVNITDGVLFYKDNAGVVQTLATKAATSGTYTSITITGGTANGVGYLNGSKQFTTGSALTFDGTNFATTGIANIGSGARIQGAGSITGTGVGLEMFVAAGVGYYTSYDRTGGAYAPINLFSGTYTAFSVGSEQMRLTSTGLGIGTSSPAFNNGSGLEIERAGVATLRVQNSSVANASGELYSGSDGFLHLESNYGSGYGIKFNVGVGSTKATLDSSGNLGLGVTPSGWSGAGNVFELGSTAGNIAGASTYLNITSNAYYNAGYKYKTTAAAAYYAQDNGKHIFYNATSGTAGNAISFTQAMTLDAGWGALLIGGTVAPASNNIRLAVQGRSGSNNGGLQLTTDGGGGAALFSNNGAGLQFWTFTGAAGSESYTERARIDSSGNLLVGTTSSTTYLATGIQVSSSNWASYFYTSATTNGGTSIGARRDTTGNFVQFYYGNDTTQVGSISTNGSATAYNTSSDYRLKDNQQPLTGSGAFIDALQPKTWEWKADGSKGVGFIAHEVQAVSPGSVVGEKDAVDKDGKPKYQAMEYGSAEFIANIVAELQSVRKRLAALEGK